MICERCGREHDGSFGAGIFCSRSCANSRTRSQETKNKISAALKSKNFHGIDRKSTWTKDSLDKWRKSISLKYPVIKGHCTYCSKEINLRGKKKNANGNYYCNGTCRNLDLNRKKLIGGKSTPKWELILRELLKEKNIEFIPNDRDVLSGGLELDIWIPGHKIGIELNGIYHYSSKPYKDKVYKFEERKRKDLLKAEEMKGLGYRLVIVERRSVKGNMKEFLNKLLGEIL